MLDDLPLIDRRADLQRGHEPYKRREVTQIKGLVVHHVGSDMSIAAAARYHVRDRGWPGLGYHFWVDKDGQVSWANDLGDTTYSQGGGGSPVPFTFPNLDFVSVVLAGDLSLTPATTAQRTAVRWLWAELRLRLGLHESMVLGHQEFKNTICPGKGMEIVGDLRHGVDLVWDRMPETLEQFQHILVDLGYNLGPYGPQGDGVDGMWGPSTRSALKAATGLSSTNFRSSMALAELQDPAG